MTVSNKILQELASLVIVRNHLSALLNSASRTVIGKDDVKKVSSVIAELDKNFLDSLLRGVPSLETKPSGFVKYGDNAFVENGIVVVDHNKTTGVSEVDADAINRMRSAVVSIESELGAMLTSAVIAPTETNDKQLSFDFSKPEDVKDAEKPVKKQAKKAKKAE